MKKQVIDIWAWPGKKNLLLLITIKNKGNNGAKSQVPIFRMGREKTCPLCKDKAKEKNLNLSAK